jgi:prevent-host-death family protein
MEVSMSKVTSGEFQREFGRYRALAQREAVIITNHGRDDVVLLGADDYARLRGYEQKLFHVSQFPREIIDELGSVAPPKGAAKFDREYEP